MPWNQSGDNKPKDPWGQGSKGNGSGDQKPPELDKIFKDIKKQFSSLLGGGKPGKPSGGKNDKPVWPLPRLLAILLLGLIGVFIFSGFYQVPAGQKSVVLLYGQVNRIAGPGLHWHNPLLESLHLVTLGADSHYRVSGELASADGQLLKVSVEVGYKVADPAAYVLATAEPVTLLQNLTLTELRQVVGRNTLPDLLSKPASQWANRLQKQLQAALLPWHSGLELTEVKVSDITLPDVVTKAAAGDAAAQATAQTDVQQAQQYQQAQLLAAQGQVARMLAEANAYQQKAVDYAEGETSRFNSLLASYEKAPRVTRDRLYLDTMEQVFAQTSKVLVMDSKGTQQLALPLAELIRGVQPAKPAAAAELDAAAAAKPAPKPKAAPTAPPSLYGEPSSKAGATP